MDPVTAATTFATLVQLLGMYKQEHKDATDLDHQTRSAILKMPKADFIANWAAVKNAIFDSVAFSRSALRIPVSRLIPYPAQLIPLTYFFFKNLGKHPSPVQAKWLTQNFFWSAFSNRFSSAVESKIAQDLKRMDKILAGSAPDYAQTDDLKLTLDDLRHYWFSTGDGFCKAVLCIYAYQQPKSFASNDLVHLDNSWLKASFSKNYHHFFPRAFLRKQGVEDWQANSILNITIVDDYLNKREIGAKPPSQYMKKFQSQNENLVATMDSHLIGDLADFGVWSDSYDEFLEKRGERLLQEIQKRLFPTI